MLHIIITLYILNIHFHLITHPYYGKHTHHPSLSHFGANRDAAQWSFISCCLSFTSVSVFVSDALGLYTQWSYPCSIALGIYTQWSYSYSFPFLMLWDFIPSAYLFLMLGTLYQRSYTCSDTLGLNTQWSYSYSCFLSHAYAHYIPYLSWSSYHTHYALFNFMFLKTYKSFSCFSQSIIPYSHINIIPYSHINIIPYSHFNHHFILTFQSSFHFHISMHIKHLQSFSCL
jgi:hypothetical protein